MCQSKEGVKRCLFCTQLPIEKVDHGDQTNTISSKKRRELLGHEQIVLMGTMLGMAVNGQLPHSAQTKHSKKFSIAPRTVALLWKTCSQSRAKGMVVLKEVLSKKSNRGSKLKWDRKEMIEPVKVTPSADWMTQ